MKLDLGKQRKSIRLKGWDYSSPGGYFVTICTHNQEHLFGEIREGKMPVNEYVNILRQCWGDLPLHYSNVQLDEFIVMPNHVHGVIIMKDIDNMLVGDGFKPSRHPNRTGYKPVPTRQHHGLTEIIRAFKTFSARRINISQDTQGRPVWQRSFHDHIIRNDREFDRIRQYIINNPIGWDTDEYDLELGCRD